MATYDYITLGGKKVECIKYEPDFPSHRTIRKTFTRRVVSIGLHANAWDVTLLFEYENPASGYAAYADVVGWLESELQATTEQAFIGMLGETGTVAIESAGKPAPAEGILVGWWTCDMRLVKLHA